VFPQLDVEIVKRSDAAGAFKVLPRRRVVVRTLAWLNRCRRLCKDFENLTRNALLFFASRRSDSCYGSSVILKKLFGRTLSLGIVSLLSRAVEHIAKPGGGRIQSGTMVCS
jgi:hypothetical protein